MHKISFSIVIPVYNSEKILPKLIDSVIFYLNKDLSEFKYEIILINDFSSDKSWEVIKELSEKLINLKGLNLPGLTLGAAFGLAGVGVIVLLIALFLNPGSGLEAGITDLTLNPNRFLIVLSTAPEMNDN